MWPFFIEFIDKGGKVPELLIIWIKNILIPYWIGGNARNSVEKEGFRRPDFWKATLENWQSEFLAVGSFVALTVFLRQRGSTQSKPVGAPHHSTGVEG